MSQRVVHGSEQENGTLLQNQLARVAHFKQPTMAALLARMERDGLISRETHATAKRASHVRLSAKAKARVPTAKVRLAEVAERATTGFSERKRATLIALLRRVVDNLGPPLARRHRAYRSLRGAAQRAGVPPPVFFIRVAGTPP